MPPKSPKSPKSPIRSPRPKSAPRGLESRIERLERELHVERRREFVERELATGRIDESEVEAIESAYDAAPAEVAAIVSSRPVRVAVARKMSEESNAAYQAEAGARLGLAEVI
jgi:hypothetical protein